MQPPKLTEMALTPLRIALGLAVLGALVYLVVASTTSRPGSRQWRGVDVGSRWHVLPEEEAIRDLREAAALGADMVRVDLRWNWLQPDGPDAYSRYRMARVERLLEVARSEGLRVLGQASFSPCWASTAPRTAGGECAPDHGLYPPADPDKYGAFISEIVSRWGDALGALEIWNEPNQVAFWRGTPAQYVALVRNAAQAISRSDHPDLPVVAGALSGSNTSYLQELYDEDIDRWSDAISVHPYDVRWGGPGAGFRDPTIPRRGDQWSFAAGVPAIHEVMLANGDPDPLWITEFGYPDCPATPYCVDPELQGDYLASAMRTASVWPYVDVFLIFRLRDWFSPQPGMQFHFGLLRRDWSPKPAADSVREALAALD